MASEDKSPPAIAVAQVSEAAGLEAEVARHPFLTGLSPGQSKVLAGCAMRTRFEAGECIFLEGDSANRFYLIQRGRVVLRTNHGDVEPLVVQELGAGDVLGWSWLFAPYRWYFTAVATEPTDAIFFYGTWLREQCEQDKALGFALMKRMAEAALRRLQATRKELIKQAGKSHQKA